MEKIRQNDYIRAQERWAQERCAKETRYYIDEDRAYVYPSCVYYQKGKCMLTACVRKDVK